MIIRMKQTERGSVDGHKVAVYTAGREYELLTPGEIRMGEVFVRGGLAVQVRQRKAHASAPHNKGAAG